MIVHERRASAILFNLLRTRADARPFLLPANVCTAVPATLTAAAQRFALVDIAEPWLEIDGARCLDLVRRGDYGGIVFVRPYGSERDPTAFFTALRRLQGDFLVIDDKCLCAPDSEGALLSPAADVTLFSTGYAKFVDIGGGAFGHLRDGVAYRRARQGPAWLELAAPAGSWSDYREVVLAAARVAAAHKRQLNDLYAEAIPPQAQLAAELQQWRFNIRVPRAADLIESLRERGLFASRHYAPLGDFPVAADLHASIVNLFNDRYYTREQARLTAALVRRHLQA